LLYPLKLL